MKKNDIIAVYAEKNNVTKKAATEVVGSVIDIIKDGILTEDRKSTRLNSSHNA